MSLCYVNIYHKNVLYGGLLKVIVLYCIALHCIALHCIALHCIVFDAVKLFYDHSTHPSSSYIRINNVHKAITPGCPCVWPR